MDKQTATEALELNRCDQISLGWVSEEIGALLKEVRISLEDYAEDNVNTASLIVSGNALHQLRNTLVMIKLYGASMLAEELEEVVKRLSADTIDNLDAALETLMTGVVALREYLERLENGAPDVPIILMPIMNELRAVREVHLLSESAFFSPSLDSLLSNELSRPIYDRGELQEYLEEKRPLFNRCLVSWYQDGDSALWLGKLSAIYEGTRGHASDLVWRYFRLLAVLCGYLSVHPEESSSAVKLIVGRSSQVIRHILKNGEEGIRNNFPVDQLKNLLFYIGQLKERDGRVDRLKAEYGLKRELAYLEVDEETLAARPSPSVLHAVNEAVQKDITAIKDWIDIYIRGESRDTTVLTGVLPRLRSLSDTLGMLGLGTERIELQKQVESLGQLVEKGERIDTETLEDLAEQILRTEIVLPELFGGRSSLSEWTIEGGDGVTETELFSYLWDVVKESKVSMAHIKEAITDFLSGEKTREDLKDAIHKLHHVSGAMEIINAGHIRQLLEEAREYIEEQVIDNVSVPAANDINMLADVISGIEYFIEVAPYGCQQEEEIVSYVRKALNRLQGKEETFTEEAKPDIAPLPDFPVSEAVEIKAEAEPLSELAEESPVDAEAEEAVALAEESVALSEELHEKISEEVSVQPEAAEAEEESVVSEVIDDDILEIFREEAAEQLQLIQEYYPRWKAYPDDEESLMTVRRAFHTLKGSGRMVGAFEIGEYAWALENLLNRIIDGTVSYSEETEELFDRAIGFLPNLFDDEEREASADERSAIEERAHRLASREYVKAEEPAVAEVIDITEAVAAGEEEIPAAVEEQAEVAEAPEAEVAAEAEEEVSEAEITAEAVEAEVSEAEIAAEAVEAEVSEAEVAAEAVEAEISEPEVAAEAVEAEVSEAEIAAEAVEAEVSEAEVAAEAVEAEVSEPGIAAEAVKAEISELEIAAEAEEEVSEAEIAAQAVETEVSEPAPELEPEPEPEPYSARYDPMLAMIFRDEAKNHLGVISSFLDHCDPSGCKVDDDLIRAFHTLHGSAQLAEVDEIGELSTAAERFVTARQNDERWLDADDIGVIRSALNYISDAVERVAEGNRDLPEYQELVAEFKRLSVQRPEAEPEQEQESLEHAVVEKEPDGEQEAVAEVVSIKAEEEGEELRVLFLEEARELLEEMEHQFAGLEDSRFDEDSVASLKRILHTLKGAARLTHIPPIGDLSHAFESMLIRAEELGVLENDSVYQNARVAADRINTQVEEVEEGAEVSPFSDMVQFLEETDFAEAISTVAPAEIEQEPEPEPEPEPEQIEVAEEKGGEDFQAAAEIIPFPPQKAQKVSGKQKRLRISTNVLDHMVNGLGEVMTFGTRLQQQRGTIDTNLSEFEETVNRLREQLRTLEIETESQILFRFEREGGDTENEQFDPLELDRFSTIQELSRALAETVDDLANIKRNIDDTQEEASMLLAQHVRLTTSMQDMLLHTRTLPFTRHVARLERLIRQTSGELGKQVELVVDGKEEEIDRSVLDKTLPLLEHLLRNAIYHGIESPDERRAAGKSENGRIDLSIRRQGMELILRLKDDGKGLDRNKIRQTAIDRGVIDADSPELKDKELFRLVTSAGFTTVGDAGQISGRGVGLDVVKTEVEKLGGRIEVTSRENEGTDFTIFLPFHVAMTDALLIQQGDVWYAIPDNSVEAIVRIGRDELEACYRGEQEGFKYAGTVYPVQYFGNLLSVTDTRGSVEGQEKWVPLLLVRSGDIPAAIQIDILHGNRQIVLKPVGSQLESVAWVSGGTILGDGSVALIIDPAALVREVSIRTDEEAQLPVEEQVPLEGRRVTVMVVDDSITMRKVAAGILQRNGYNVATAKDGLDALAELEVARPDIILLDIEMPRMDGFEFARHVRSSDEFGNTPIIMVTSRTGEKHKQRALDLGVNAYLGKPFAEDELLDNIAELVLESVE